MLSPQEALEMYPRTGVVLLIDAPDSAKIGIDNTEWQVGHKFRGFKLIPPGAHFVHYSLMEEKYMFKMGFFVYIEPGSIVVKEWNAESDTFIDMMDKEKRDRYCEAVRHMEIDAYLGAYNHEQTAVWKESTMYISQSLIKKLVGQNTIASTIVEQKFEAIRLEKEESMITQIAGNEDDEKVMAKPKSHIEVEGSKNMMDIEEMDERPALEPKGLDQFNSKFSIIQEPLHSIDFTVIPEKSHDISKTGSELTKSAIDKSELLEKLIQHEYKMEEIAILGELQVSFILFLLGENLDSFEQFKKIFIVLCCSDTYFLNNQAFYDKVFSSL